MEYVRLNTSQDYVDADLPGGVQRPDQTPASYAQLLTALPAEATCALEATGPYGLRLLAALHQAQRPVCVVTPCRCAALPRASFGAARPTERTPGY